MIKITATIVDANRALIGFMAKGTEKEFGGFSSNEIERGLPIATMIQEGFSNNQLSIVNGKVVEKGSFKINSLPMLLYNNNNYTPIDNTVNIIGRFVKNNENIGFRAAFSDGSEGNLQYQSLLSLSKWFKPGNFAIRTSSKGRQYICGKNNLSLDSLPAQYIGEEPVKKAKRTKSAAKDKETGTTGMLESGFDILDIYDFVADKHGWIINLPGTKYESTTIAGETNDGEFTSLGIGEVASPTISFTANKLNVNARFKKVGYIPVNIGGSTQQITTFVYRNKCVFSNGENYIKKFGIAVPVEHEAEVVKALGSSLALEKIKDSTITSPLGQVINAKELVFYKVDASRLDLISKKKRESSILSTEQLVNICKNQYSLKLISKAMGPKGGLIKNLKATLSSDDIAKSEGKSLFGLFSMMNESALEAIKEAGIDVYTGAYNSGASSPKKPSSGAGEGGAEAITIEYSLKGLDAGKLTGAKILDAVRANDTTKLPASVIKAISNIMSITDPIKQYEAAKIFYDVIEAQINKLNKALWLHIASMYIEGGKVKIHSHDSADWIPDTSTRVKTAKVYVNTKTGAEALTIKFTGINI